MLITFLPHPYLFFNKTRIDNFLIYIQDKKLSILSKFDLDFIILVDFNKEFSKITANKFIEILAIKILDTQIFINGENTKFGLNGNGNITLLSALQIQYNYCLKGYLKQYININYVHHLK